MADDLREQREMVLVRAATFASVLANNQPIVRMDVVCCSFGMAVPVLATGGLAETGRDGARGGGEQETVGDGRRKVATILTAGKQHQ